MSSYERKTRFQANPNQCFSFKSSSELNKGEEREEGESGKKGCYFTTNGEERDSNRLMMNDVSSSNGRKGIAKTSSLSSSSSASSSASSSSPSSSLFSPSTPVVAHIERFASSAGEPSESQIESPHESPHESQIESPALSSYADSPSPSFSGFFGDPYHYGDNQIGSLHTNDGDGTSSKRNTRTWLQTPPLYNIHQKTYSNSSDNDIGTNSVSLFDAKQRAERGISTPPNADPTSASTFTSPSTTSTDTNASNDTEGDDTGIAPTPHFQLFKAHEKHSRSRSSSRSRAKLSGTSTSLSSFSCTSSCTSSSNFHSNSRSSSSNVDKERVSRDSSAATGDGNDADADADADAAAAAGFGFGFGFGRQSFQLSRNTHQQQHQTEHEHNSNKLFWELAERGRQIMPKNEGFNSFIDGIWAYAPPFVTKYTASFVPRHKERESSAQQSVQPSSSAAATTTQQPAHCKKRNAPDSIDEGITEQNIVSCAELQSKRDNENMLDQPSSASSLRSLTQSSEFNSMESQTMVSSTSTSASNSGDTPTTSTSVWLGEIRDHSSSCCCNDSELPDTKRRRSTADGTNFNFDFSKYERTWTSSDSSSLSLSLSSSDNAKSRWIHTPSIASDGFNLELSSSEYDGLSREASSEDAADDGDYCRDIGNTHSSEESGRERRNEERRDSTHNTEDIEQSIAMKSLSIQDQSALQSSNTRKLLWLKEFVQVIQANEESQLVSFIKAMYAAMEIQEGQPLSELINTLKTEELQDASFSEAAIVVPPGTNIPTHVPHNNSFFLRKQDKYGSSASPPPLASDEHGTTCEKIVQFSPCYFAAKHRCTNSLRVLLRFSADPNESGPLAVPPLYIATHFGDDDAVQLLCSAGADPSATKQDGTPIVYSACKHGNTQCLKHLAAYASREMIEKWKTYKRKRRTLLHVAASLGHHTTLEFLVSVLDFEVDVKNDLGVTPLHEAIRAESLACVRLLIEHGARIDLREDYSGNSAMHLAVCSGSVSMLQTILHAPPLHQAPASDDVASPPPSQDCCNDMRPDIVANGEQRQSWHDISCSATQFKLHAPAWCDSNDFESMIPPPFPPWCPPNAAIEWKLMVQARISMQNHDGLTPLGVACREGAPIPIVSCLLCYGADLLEIPSDADSNHENNADSNREGIADSNRESNAEDGGRTVEMDNGGESMRVSHVGNAATNMAADVNTRQVSCPFIMAVKFGWIHLVDYFLKLDPSYMLRRSYSGCSVFHLAARADFAEIIRLIVGYQQLLDKSNDVNITDSDAYWFSRTDFGIHMGISDNGITPLYLAAQQGSLDSMAALLELQAPIDAPLRDGSTPLYGACRHGQYEAADMLMSYGADLYARTVRGALPLHAACSQDAHLIVERMIHKYDVDPWDPSNRLYGWYPLHAVARKGSLEVAKVLVEQCKNANVDCEAWLSDSTSVLDREFTGHAPRANPAFQHGVARQRVQMNAGQRNAIGSVAPVAETETETATSISTSITGTRVTTSTMETTMETGAGIGTGTGSGRAPAMCSSGAENTHEHVGPFTPLHVAALAGNLHIVRYLVKRGADVSCACSDGTTAEQFARQNGHEEVAEWLLHVTHWNQLCIAADARDPVLIVQLLQQDGTLLPSEGFPESPLDIAKSGSLYEDESDGVSTGTTEHEPTNRNNLQSATQSSATISNDANGLVAGSSHVTTSASSSSCSSSSSSSASNPETRTDAMQLKPSQSSNSNSLKYRNFAWSIDLRATISNLKSKFHVPVVGDSVEKVVNTLNDEFHSFVEEMSSRGIGKHSSPSQVASCVISYIRNDLLERLDFSGVKFSSSSSSSTTATSSSSSGSSGDNGGNAASSSSSTQSLATPAASTSSATAMEIDTEHVDSTIVLNRAKMPWLPVCKITWALLELADQPFNVQNCALFPANVRLIAKTMLLVNNRHRHRHRHRDHRDGKGNSSSNNNNEQLTKSTSASAVATPAALPDELIFKIVGYLGRSG